MPISMTKLTKPHELYEERVAEVEAKLELLKTKLKTHKEREAADPKNWGFNGDLAHVDQVLGELVSFLAN